MVGVDIGVHLWSPPRMATSPVALTFSVRSLPSLVHWLDLADMSTITGAGTAGSQVDDKSPSAAHAIQPIGGNQPATGTQTKNGHNVMVFDGANDGLLYPNLGLTGETNMTLCAVVKLDSTGSSGDALWAFGHGNEGRLEFSSNYSLARMYGNFGIDGNGQEVWNDAGIPDNWAILTFVTDGSEWRSYINGQLHSSDTQLAPWNTGVGDYGIFTTNSPNRQLKGALAEWVICKTDLSEEQLAELHQYLSVKWDIGNLSEAGTPLAVAGLSAWHDPSDAATLTQSLGEVSQWDNLYSGGNDAVQTAASSQMTTGLSTINGLNILTADGNDFYATTINAKAIFFVWGQIVDNFNAVLGGIHGGSVIDIMLNPASNTVSFDGFGTERGKWTNGDGSFTAYEENHTSKTVSNAGGIGLFIYENGPFDFTNIASRDGSTSFRFNGEFGEMVIFDREPTIEESNRVGNYLANKWGRNWVNLQ